MKETKIEPIIYLLVGLVIFFTFLLIADAKFLSSDGQTFQVLASSLTGFSGALMVRIKPRGNTPDSVEPSPKEVVKE